MEAIHKLSSVAPLPEFDLWGVPPTQITVEKDVEVEYKPIAMVDGKSQITFQINTAIDEYLKLDQMFLYYHVNMDITKIGSDQKIVLSDWDNVNISNYFQHAMIKEVQMNINNTQVSYSPHNYPYRAFLETFLGFSDSAKASHLTSAGWSNDKMDQSRNIKPIDSNVSKGRSLDLMSKLHLDLSFQGKALIGGSSVEIIVQLNDPKFYMKINGKYNVNIQVSNVSLFAHKAKISPIIVDAHRKALAISPAKYPITRVEVKQATIPSGIVDYSIDNIILGQLPRRMFVFFVDKNSFTGDFSSDPFDLKHFDLNYLSAIYDGQQHPTKAFTPNFKEKLYVREYLSLFKALNQNGTDCFINMPREKFEDMPIFAFNFAPDLSDGAGLIGHVNPIKRGPLRLQMRFGKSLPEAINVLLYCEFDNIIEIHNDGTVHTNYFNGFNAN